MGRLEKLVGNASILVLFQLFICGAYAQDTTAVQQFDLYADKLNKTEMRTSILYDRVISFAELNRQQSTKEEIDSIRQDYGNWKQVYLEMYNADYANATKENFEFFLEKARDYRIQKRKIPIGVLNFRYEYIDSNSIHDGRINMVNNQPLRSTLNTKSPYLLDSVCVLSILTDQLYTGSNTLIFDKSFYYTNTDLLIRSVTLNFNDDRGNRIVNLGDSLVLNFTTAGPVALNYSIQFENGKVVNAKSVIDIQDGGTMPCYGDALRSKLTFRDYNNQIKSAEYEYGIYFKECAGRNPDVLQNPIVIVDGFDPTDSRKVGNIFDKLNQNPHALADVLLANDHDIIVVNFLDGGDFIERNALALTDMIEFIRERTADKIIVIGPSMGGLIAKYALAQLEKRNVNHQTSLFISFDAPHQGANIPIGDQYFLYFFGKVVGDAGAREGLSQINSNAARQMLVHHQYKNGIAPVYDDYRTNLLDNIRNNGIANSNGYPMNLRKVALINGSGISTPQGINGKLFSLEKYKHRIKIAEAQIYSSPNLGTSKVTYCMAANPKDLFHARRLTKYASVVQSSPYPTNIDNVPGGYFNTQQIITGLSNGQSGNGFTVENSSHSFIPSTSSLDLKFPTPFVNYTLNIGAANLMCNSQVPFDAFYAPDENEEHVFISEKNAKWIIREIVNATKTVCVTSNTLEINAGRAFNYGVNTKNYFNKSFVVSNGGVLGININAPTGYNNEAIPVIGSSFKVEGYNNECGSMNIDVKDNGALIVGDANSNVGELIVSDNAVLKLSNNGKLIINNNSKIVIRRGSKLIIGKDASIRLNGNNAQLIIEGDIEVEEDGIFTFSGEGFVNLKSNNISWGKNSKLLLVGVDANDKVLEIADAYYLLQGYNGLNHPSIEIKNGLINLVGVGSFINSASTISLENVVINGGRGLVINGQKEVSILNCEFSNCKVGLTSYTTLLEKFGLLGSPLVLANTTFNNCDIAIKVFGKGFNINGVNFIGCKQGVIADGVDMHSELANSTLLANESQQASHYGNAGVNFIGSVGSALTISNSTISKFNTGVYNSQSTLNLKCSNIALSNYQNLWVANNAILNMSPSINSYAGNNTLTVQNGVGNKNILLEQVNSISIANGSNRFKLNASTNNFFIAGTMLNLPTTMNLQRNNWYLSIINANFSNPPAQSSFIVSRNTAPSSPRVGVYNLLPVLGMGSQSECISYDMPVEDPCKIPGSCKEVLMNDPLVFAKNADLVKIDGYNQSPYNIVLKNIFNQIKDDVNHEYISNYFNALCNLYLFNDKYDSSDVIYLKDLTYATIQDMFYKIYFIEYYKAAPKPAINFTEALQKLELVQTKREQVLKLTNNTQRAFAVLMDIAQLKSKLGKYQDAVLFFNAALNIANSTNEINLANHWLCLTNIKHQVLSSEFKVEQIDSMLNECQALSVYQVSLGKQAVNIEDSLGRDEDIIPEIRVSPNPSFGELTIKAMGEKMLIDRIELINILGDVVLKNTFSEAVSETNFYTTGVESGIYFLKVYTSEGCKTKRIIIRRD